MSDSLLGVFPSLNGPGAEIPSDEGSLESLFDSLSTPKKPPEYTPLPQLNPAARTGAPLDSESPPPVETPPIPQQRPKKPAAPPQARPQPQAKNGFRDLADIFGSLTPTTSRPPDSVQTNPPQPAAAFESLADMFPSMQPSVPAPKSLLSRQADAADPSSLIGPNLGDVSVAREQAQKAKQDAGFRQELLKKINTPYQPPDMKPINPLTDFSNWWQRYKANVNEPVREAWEDHTWFRPAHLALSYVTYPFNVLTSVATTTAGFEKAPTITDAVFMTSRDGLHFRRWSEAFLRPGPRQSGSWVYGDNMIFWGLVETASALGDASPLAASGQSMPSSETPWFRPLRPWSRRRFRRSRPIWRGIGWILT